METKEVKAKSTGLLCDSAELHEAIRIDGITEANINPNKVRTLKSIEWTANGFLLITANKRHLLPAAAVKDSILKD